MSRERSRGGGRAAFIRRRARELMTPNYASSSQGAFRRAQAHYRTVDAKSVNEKIILWPGAVSAPADPLDPGPTGPGVRGGDIIAPGKTFVSLGTRVHRDPESR